MEEGPAPSTDSGRHPSGIIRVVTAPLEFMGERLFALLDQIGAVLLLFVDAGRWIGRSATNRRVRLGKAAIVTQIVRVGVRSVFIVSLVSGCVGFILAFQLSPPLDEFGRKDLVANIVAIAVLRELGPLIGAIVLTGFAGASMAAEIGTMVVGEEIEALEAHALNPVRFLVVPRVVATILSMTALAVLSDLVSVGASLGVGVLILDIPYSLYKANMLEQAKLVDFVTGVGKAVVFGALIGLIACANGLRVSGGAAGVGRATTNTVVQCVVSIIIADLIFTAIFFALKLV